MLEGIDNASEVEKLWEEEKENLSASQSSPDYEIHHLALVLTSSEEEHKKIKENYFNRLKNIIKEKEAGKISMEEFYSERYPKLTHGYMGVGAPEELRKKTRKNLEKIDFSSEKSIEDAVKYCPGEEVEAFYHSYHSYLQLEEGIEGKKARDEVYRKIARKLERTDSTKESIWKNNLPGEGRKSLEKFL